MKRIYFLLFMFQAMHDVSFSQQASLMLNEINPNITAGNDLVELFAVNGGSVNGFTIQQAITSPVILATLPQVTVAVGDIIVVHLNPATAAGDAPGSETGSKNEFPNAVYSANYDLAWDINGVATSLTFSNRVIVVKDTLGVIQDAVAFTNNGGSPVTFPADVQSVQGQNLWLPADCGSVPCTYSSTPTVETISVNWQGVGSSATGNSVQRLSNTDTNTHADWSTAKGPS